MAATTLFWHDYETTGADSRRDRAVQFAGVRTDLELNPVAEPVMVFCRPVADVLPHPEACLITGITPQHAEREGILEAEFAAVVQEELGAPGTCGVGYNSLRFDDEFTRHLLYRNFHDPYEREWKDGNSRWDLIDLMRMCYALRPAGIEWPLREDGTPSFRLEDLARANGLVHARAHDALSDVEATIGLARRVREQQQRLFDFHFALRRKQRAFELLDVAHRVPVVHVSSRYPASRGCLAIVVPLAMHTTNANGVIVFDLDADPAPLIELDAEEIADRVFARREDLPEDVERIPLKLVHANRSPALAPLSALKGVDAQRIGLDSTRALEHLERLRAVDGLAEKVQRVFAGERTEATGIDPELALYSGFLPDADRRRLRDVRQASPSELARSAPVFGDPRYAELLFRYRARNWPHSLDVAESARWEAFRHDRMTRDTPLTTLTLARYFETIAALRTTATPDQNRLLDALEAWGRDQPAFATSP
jgi:exodeoxyribonuclease I